MCGGKNQPLRVGPFFIFYARCGVIFLCQYSPSNLQGARGEVKKDGGFSPLDARISICDGNNLHKIIVDLNYNIIMAYFIK